MDIIFQSGEFYGQDSSFWTNVVAITGAILGALISGLIAIWIFRRGLAEQKRKERESRIARDNELEDYIFHVIGFMKSTMIQQVNEIGLTSRALKDLANRNLSLNIVSALSTDEVNAVKSDDLYRVFVTNREGNTKDKAADILNLRSCFRYVDQQKESFIAFNQTLHDRLDEYRNSWNSHLKRLLDLYNQFVLHASQNAVNPGSDPFLDFYKTIMVVKQRELIANGQAENLKIAHSEMIQPLKDFIKENSSVMDQRIILISSSVIGCDQAFQETNELRFQKRAQVLKYGRNLLGVKQLMNECIDNTKKRKHVTVTKNL